MTARRRYKAGEEIGGARKTLPWRPFYNNAAGTSQDYISDFVTAEWTANDAYNTIWIEEPSEAHAYVYGTGSGAVTAGSMERHIRNGLEGYLIYRDIWEKSLQVITAANRRADLIVVDARAGLPEVYNSFGGVDVIDVLTTIYESGTYFASGLPHLDLASLQQTPFSTSESYMAICIFHGWLRQLACRRWYAIFGQLAQQYFGSACRIVARDCSWPLDAAQQDWSKDVESYKGEYKPRAVCSADGVTDGWNCPELLLDTDYFVSLKEWEMTLYLHYNSLPIGGADYRAPIPVISSPAHEGEGNHFVTQSIFDDAVALCEDIMLCTDILIV